MHGVIPEALASDKLAIGNDRSKGSQTAKVCTDEQVLQRENYLQGV